MNRFTNRIWQVNGISRSRDPLYIVLNDYFIKLEYDAYQMRTVAA